MIPRIPSNERAEAAFLVVAVGLLAVVLALAVVTASGSDESVEEADIDATGSEYAQDPPAVAEEAGTATVGGEEFETVQAAVDHASPGDTVVLEGTFEGSVTIEQEGITVTAGPAGAVIDGQYDGHVVNVSAPNVTVEDLWIRASGADTGNEDAGVFVAGDDVTLSNLHLSDNLWGVWIHGVEAVTVTDSYIEGREDVQPRVERGNGIHLWSANGTTLENNVIVEVRDGIYYSWSNNVLSENNTLADNRYGVHYMYSDDNRLANNTAIDNDVGYALMVSQRLEIEGNEAINNRGSSGHGILVKEVDNSLLRDNVVANNQQGFWVYNSNGNDIHRNLVVQNDIGIVSTAGSERQEYVNNSFIDNTAPTGVTTNVQHQWNGTERGNYWSSARPIDASGDGVSDVEYRPEGLVEQITDDNPEAEVFAGSPAFDAIRLAESSFPVIESAGVIDHHPLVEPPHDNWREYAEE